MLETELKRVRDAPQAPAKLKRTCGREKFIEGIKSMNILRIDENQMKMTFEKRFLDGFLFID